MEDAYVIGIRLALENGVSVGVAAIAAELQALDAAIAVTSANLQRLQAIPVTLGGMARPGFKMDPAPPQTERGPDATPLLPSAGTPAPPPPTAPAVQNVRQAERSLSTPAATPAPPPPSPMAAAPVIRITMPPALSPAGSPPPLAIAPASSPVTSSSPVPPVMVSPVRDQTRPDALGPAAAVRTTAPAAPQSTASGRPLPTPAAVRTAALAPSVPPAGRGDAARESAAPGRSERSLDVREPTPAAAPGYTTASAAPPPRQSQSSPMQGDVYLDGTRLGRWMADHMARDAGRPQSGTSGFDPRLGPAWPGPLQGS